MSEEANKQQLDSLDSTAIEESLRQAIREDTPDMLDALLSELGLEQDEAADTEAAAGAEATAGAGAGAEAAAGTGAGAEATAGTGAGAEAAAAETPARPPIMPRGASPVASQAEGTSQKSARVRRWYRAAISAAAVVALVVIGFFATTASNNQVMAVVGLDVNPSVELAVNNNERVVSAAALNDDAAEILGDLELEGTNINTACYAVVGSMLAKGYLRPDANSILVSARSSDPQTGKNIEREVSESLNSYLQDSDVAVAIWGEYVEDDEELESSAESWGVSLGKAWLIRQLIATGKTKADEASLTKLSTQELLLLAQDKQVESDTFMGTSDTSAYIPRDEASDIALADAGVKKEDATIIEVEFDCDDGALVYDVEFEAAGTVHDYEIDAQSGKILHSESREIPVVVPAASGGAVDGVAYDDPDDYDDYDDPDDPDDYDDPNDDYDYDDDADDYEPVSYDYDDADDDYDDYDYDYDDGGDYDDDDGGDSDDDDDD